MAKAAAKKDIPLTDKQIRFCEEYLIDLNATAAAKRAGYSEKTAAVIASQNLIKLNVAEFLAKRRKELSEEIQLDQKWVLNRLKDISDRCVQAVPVMIYNPATKSMEQATEINEAGDEVGIWQFDSSGANRSTEMIGKHLGFFEKDNEQSKPISPQMTEEQFSKYLKLSLEANARSSK